MAGGGTGGGAAGQAEVETWPNRPPHLIVNVTDLRKRLGQRREVTIEATLARQQVLDTHTLRTPVRGEITVESIERGVSLHGHVSFDWEGDCRRCLEPVQGTTEIEIDEICQVHAPPNSDIVDFDGEKIDLLPLIRDAVGLSLPLAPLCRDDCPGPDPDRYPALTEDELDAAEAADEEDRPPADPRWAALDGLDLN